MNEENILSTTIEPDSPNINPKQEIHVSVPTASNNTVGVAKFDARHFDVDREGRVKLRSRLDVSITMFDVDESTGEITITYSDGIVKKFRLPNQTFEYVSNSLYTTIEFTEVNFTSDDKGYYLVISNRVTGFTNDEFIVSLEEKNDGDTGTQYYTVMDSVVKSSDGSLLIFADQPYNGRVLLLGGNMYSNTQITNIEYSYATGETVGKLILHYLDGGAVDIELDKVVTDVYLDIEAAKGAAISAAESYADTRFDEAKSYTDAEIAKVLSSVFEFKSSTTFEDLLNGKYLNEEHVNDVWLVTDNFVTTNDFKDGLGINIGANELVTVIKYGDSYKFDILGSLVDLQNYYTKDESDNKYSAKDDLQNYYTKDESDDKYSTALNLEDGDNGGLQQNSFIYDSSNIDIKYKYGERTYDVKGTQKGDEVPGAKAKGYQSAAFGGLRYDFYTNAATLADNKLELGILTEHFGALPTSAEGAQSFAYGGSTHAYGDWSFAGGKDTEAYQKASFVLGGGNEAGMSPEEFEKEFPDGKDDYQGLFYDDSWSFAFATGELTKSKGRASFAANGFNYTWANFSAVFGWQNKIEKAGANSFASGQDNVIKAKAGFAANAGNTVEHNFSALFGEQNKSGTTNQTIVGQYNRYGKLSGAWDAAQDGETPVNPNGEKDFAYYVTKPDGEGHVRIWPETMSLDAGDNNTQFGVATGTDKYNGTRHTAFRVLKDSTIQHTVIYGQTRDKNIVRKRVFSTDREGRIKFYEPPVDPQNPVRKKDLDEALKNYTGVTNESVMKAINVRNGVTKFTSTTNGVSTTYLQLDSKYKDWLDEQMFTIPTITNFKLSINTGGDTDYTVTSSKSYKIGSMLRIAELQYTVNDKDNVKTETLYWYKNSTQQELVDKNNSKHTPGNNYNIIPTDNAGSVYYSIQGKANNKIGTSFTSNKITITIYWPSFIGTSTSDDLSDVSSLTEVNSSSLGTQNVTVPEGGAYIYFVTPTSINGIKLGVIDVDYESLDDVTVKVNGKSKSYKRYRTSQKAAAGPYKLIIS